MDDPEKPITQVLFFSFFKIPKWNGILSTIHREWIQLGRGLVTLGISYLQKNEGAGMDLTIVCLLELKGVQLPEKTQGSLQFLEYIILKKENNCPNKIT